MLTADEIKAASEYRRTSTFFHATQQGWNCDDFRKDFDTFYSHAHRIMKDLDGAIEKSRLPNAMVLLSGHSQGSGAIGSLKGSPDRFVGLEFSYPGYISCSSDVGTAHKFLTSKSAVAFPPVLLVFHLPADYQALNMDDIPGGNHEFEYLIGRHRRFSIAGATPIEVGGLAGLELKMMPIVDQVSTTER